MEEYSEMNGQNDEQNTGGEFGGSYYQHNAMPREKNSGQNSCAGYILVGILCLLVGIAVGSCTTTLAISGIKEAAESILPGEDNGSGDNDDSGFSFEWHFGGKKPENNRPAKDEEYQEPEKKQYTGREMPVLDGQVPLISDTVNPAPDIVEQTFEGVVGVNSYEKVKDKDELEGYGSGFVISSEGYIVTNAHVIKGASKVTVTLPDNDKQEIDAEVVGYDSTMDIAVLYIRKDGLKPLALGSAENVRVGDFTIAIGNPSGSELAGTATFGIISATSRNVNIDGRENEYLQTDAAINPGNSGGALVNTRGELIGINAMLYSQTGSFSGYGFAIPTSIMNKVVADLKQYGTVQRALIGIQGQDVKNYVDAKKDKGEDVDLGTMEGIYVAKVSEESAAEEAGMKEGDVITAIDGKPVGKMAELQEVLAKKRPGDKVTVTYLRDKKKATKTLTLKNEKGNTQVVKKADLDVLGGNFRAVTDAQKEQMNIGYGLEVLKVNAGKLKNAGITKGFIIQRVNDSAVKTIEDLQNAVKEASTSKDPVLYIQGVYPTGKKAYFAVPLED